MAEGTSPPPWRDPCGMGRLGCWTRDPRGTPGYREEERRGGPDLSLAHHGKRSARPHSWSEEEEARVREAERAAFESGCDVVAARTSPTSDQARSALLILSPNASPRRA
jgi:hypothetical protein